MNREIEITCPMNRRFEVRIKSWNNVHTEKEVGYAYLLKKSSRQDAEPINRELIDYVFVEGDEKAQFILTCDRCPLVGGCKIPVGLNMADREK